MTSDAIKGLAERNQFQSSSRAALTQRPDGEAELVVRIRNRA